LKISRSTKKPTKKKKKEVAKKGEKSLETIEDDKSKEETSRENTAKKTHPKGSGGKKPCETCGNAQPPRNPHEQPRQVVMIGGMAKVRQKEY